MERGGGGGDVGVMCSGVGESLENMSHFWGKNGHLGLLPFFLCMAKSFCFDVLVVFSGGAHKGGKRVCGLVVIGETNQSNKSDAVQILFVIMGVLELDLFL